VPRDFMRRWWNALMADARAMASNESLAAARRASAEGIRTAPSNERRITTDAVAKTSPAGGVNVKL
jgi:hypothetical protein